MRMAGIDHLLGIDLPSSYLTVKSALQSNYHISFDRFDDTGDGDGDGVFYQVILTL